MFRAQRRPKVFTNLIEITTTIPLIETKMQNLPKFFHKTKATSNICVYYPIIWSAYVRRRRRSKGRLTLFRRRPKGRLTLFRRPKGRLTLLQRPKGRLVLLRQCKGRPTLLRRRCKGRLIPSVRRNRDILQLIDIQRFPRPCQQVINNSNLVILFSVLIIWGYQLCKLYTYGFFLI